MQKIRSDPALLSDVRKYGKFDTNACFQCGSCTVICDLSESSALFPRRIVRYVLLGLRDLLDRCLEPWLCHDCGDCSVYCPRQAEPREAMMTLRRYLGSQYDWTGIGSKLRQSKKWYIGTLSSVSILVLLLIMIYHTSVVRMSFSDFSTTYLGFEHMFGTMTYFTSAVILFPLLVLISNALRMYWLTIHKDHDIKIPLKLYFSEFKIFLLHIFTHKKFSTCSENRRWPKHWLLAFGCSVMFIIKAFFLGWFQTDNIYPLYHPQRWIGYMVAIFLIYGSVDIIISRIRKKKEIHKFSELNDFVFPIMLFLTVISGIAVHLFRYKGLELASHYIFAFHVAIVVPMLVVEIPFGKLSHMIYRPLAVYFHTIKEKAREQELPDGAVLDHAG